MGRLARLTAVFVFSAAIIAACGTSPEQEVRASVPIPTYDYVGMGLQEAAAQGTLQLYLQHLAAVQEQNRKAAYDRQVAAKIRATQHAVRAASVGAPMVSPSLGPCGGDLPPCFVKKRESGGDYRVWNGRCYAPVGWNGSRSPCGGSTASGGWQILRSTWAGFGGYVNAADAPPEVQDAKARLLWAGGRGCFHWSAC